MNEQRTSYVAMSLKINVLGITDAYLDSNLEKNWTYTPSAGEAGTQSSLV